MPDVTPASPEEQRKAAAFVGDLQSQSVNNGTFDSAAADSALSNALNASGSNMPDRMHAIFDAAGDEGRSVVARFLLDGVAEYQRRHGRAPGGDVLLNAMQVGYSLTPEGRKAARISLDSANQDHHDALSLHPSAPQIGIMQAIAQAIPFAGYAPADLRSNEGRIIIISHQAAKAAGTYAVGASLDGVASGEPFMTSSRTLAVAASGDDSDHYTGTFRAGMTDHETANGATAAVKTIRGRTQVYVNGIPVAREVSADGSGASAISGKATIGGSEFVIGGSITPSTGAFDVTSTPALPGGAKFAIEAFIDFEADQEALTARVGVNATTYKIFAVPDRAIITASIDSVGQFELETGFSPLTQGSEAARIQWYNERHYRALRKMYRIAEANGNTQTYNFDWSNNGQQKTRAQIWQDFGAVLGIVSQQMAIDTVEHGVTHLYVPANVAQQMQSLPRELFEPSGITVQAGIYRVGRLFGTYEIYYSPKVVTGSGATATILCLGTSPSSARNPVIVGDAVAPIFMPRGVLDDMKQGYNVYTRGFTEVNPHKPSALGAALISVTNLF